MDCVGKLLFYKTNETLAIGKMSPIVDWLFPVTTNF